MLLVDTDMWLLRGGGSTTVATSWLEPLCVIGVKGVRIPHWNMNIYIYIYICTVNIHIHVTYGS